MIRLTLGQLQMAVACAQEVHSVERARDALPAGDMLDAVTTRTEANPLGSAVAVRVPRAVVVDALNQQRATSVSQLARMGIELDPQKPEAAAPGTVHEFGEDVTLVSLRHRARELRAAGVLPTGEISAYMGSVPRSLGGDRDGAVQILMDRIHGFVPYWRYGTRVAEPNEAGSVELWRIVVRD